MMEIQKALAFPKQEYLGRLERVRTRMAREGLDVLLLHTPENICYLSGHQTPGYYFVQALLVPGAGDDPVFIARVLELGNTTAYSWLDGDHRIGYSDTDDPIAVIVEAMRDRGLDRGRLGIEKSSYAFLSIEGYERLKALLGLAEIANGSGIVEQERAIKSPAEIDYIRAACAIAVQGTQTAADKCRAGMTENELASLVDKTTVENGGEYAGLPLFISSGHRTLISHATPSAKVIAQGDNVLLELTGVVNRYAGPLFRTLSVGTPSNALAGNAAIVEDMLGALIEAIRPEVTSHDVDRAATAAAVKAGLGEGVRKRAGYSVGINFAPDWGEGHFLDLKRDDPTVLRPGMVFHVPQTLRLEGEAPVAISETLLVTEEGREVLTDFPRELIVV